MQTSLAQRLGRAINTYAVALAVSLGAVIPALADGLIRPDSPDQYTVVKGDTLWDISETFLNSPWLWPEIWQANPEIANPHLIYPGDVVRLSYVDGRPVLSVQRNQVIKLSPTARPEPLAGAIPTLPMAVIGPYLTGNQMVSPGVIDASAYILAQRDGKLLSADGDVAYARGESVYGLERYGIYRAGRQFIDTVSREVLGVEMIEVGQARVINRDAGLTRISLSGAVREIRAADRLLPLPQARTADFVPSKPPSNLEGEILAVIDGVQQVGQFDIIVLNVGLEQGVDAGNVFAITTDGARVLDPVSGESVQLPDERTGLTMVFRAFDQLSYGLVLSAQRAMRVGDSVRAP